MSMAETEQKKKFEHLTVMKRHIDFIADAIESLPDLKKDVDK